MHFNTVIALIRFPSVCKQIPVVEAPYPMYSCSIYVFFCDWEENYGSKDIFSCFTQTKCTNLFGVFIIILLFLLYN